MASSIVTVRVDHDTLRALKERVRRDGTTVSATIVRLLRAELGPPRPKAKHQRTSGMFAGQFADLELAELRQGRAEASARLLRKTRERRR